MSATPPTQGPLRQIVLVLTLVASAMVGASIPTEGASGEIAPLLEEAEKCWEVENYSCVVSVLGKIPVIERTFSMDFNIALAFYNDGGYEDATSQLESIRHAYKLSSGETEKLDQLDASIAKASDPKTQETWRNSLREQESSFGVILSKENESCGKDLAKCTANREDRNRGSAAPLGLSPRQAEQFVKQLQWAEMRRLRAIADDVIPPTEPDQYAEPFQAVGSSRLSRE